MAGRSGFSTLIAAADTFRAAAVDQVKVWGERSGVQVVANASANADPAAVVTLNKAGISTPEAL